jgi:antitoxin component YwqK of YwqJK toxin-antitoxin module
MKDQINQIDSEGLPHGVWELYWPNGTLMWKKHYLNGKLHGLSENYYSDGTSSRRGNYLNGTPRGVRKSYHADRTLYQKSILSILNDREDKPI